MVIFWGSQGGSLQMNKGSSHGPTGNHHNTTSFFLYIPVRWSDGRCHDQKDVRDNE